MAEIDLPIRFLALAHGLAATGITIHVLLNKRNVRAAIGWIGLAWLSPFLGCILYWLFGINRVARRALRLNRNVAWRETSGKIDGTVGGVPGAPEQIAVIAAVGQQVTRSPAMGGNAVSLLRCGDEAYPSMLAAIRNARKTIALASYVFRYDSVGRSFIEALAGARSRGVEVRVLLDGIGGGYVSSSAAENLQINAVPVGRFLHDRLPWRMPLLNMRNHKKLLIVDGSIGFTGGLNIGAENVVGLRPAAAVYDVHFGIEGPVVEQMLRAFCLDWQFATGETLTGDIWYPVIPPAGATFARGISEGPDEDIDKLEMVLLAALGEARTRIRIVTPYFLPDERLVSALALAALRGVEVEIILPEHSNKPIVDWAVHAHLSDLIQPGCRLFVGAGPFDHTKLMTVDGLWCLVGSANWDERSLRLNFEFNLEIYDAALTGNIDRLIDEKLARARRLVSEELDARAFWVKLRDAAARLFLPYL
ncbi:MAG: PLDc N-terminal domain-containing protein [Rhodospirillaceae bacterium]|nr:PLDc N-terminal domain-containing protein [Rhodospirillaceae bacterium]